MHNIKKAFIIGGDFNDGAPRPSKIVSSIAEEMSLSFGYTCTIFNGGSVSDLLQIQSHIDKEKPEVIIWMPNIPNNIEKTYPVKPIGSILFVSKVMREDTTKEEAIARIFKTHGNAVITIDTSVAPFRFELIDALGNFWYEGTFIGNLVLSINNLANWTANSVRVTSSPLSSNKDLEILLSATRLLADKLEEVQGRYFGNVSTRCSALFPSYMQRDTGAILVSRRNVSKKRIEVDDMLCVIPEYDGFSYIGNNKPSVDTPIQCELYKCHSDINFMIHGHAYIEHVDFPISFTKEYFPCGDLREFEVVSEFWNTRRSRKHNYAKHIVNLINHGFLILAHDSTLLENIIEDINNGKLKILRRQIGERVIV